MKEESGSPIIGRLRPRGLFWRKSNFSYWLRSNKKQCLAGGNPGERRHPGLYSIVVKWVSINDAAEHARTLFWFVRQPC